MRITVIGWYGTETIGDRAILAGIIRIFGYLQKNMEMRLGTLHPILTERTLLEDIPFYLQCSFNNQLKVDIFDSLKRKELNENIKSSDLLLIGGGPLMDIDEMYMLRYAFRVAKKHHIKSIVLGCGWGPLSKQKYIDCALDVVQQADFTIFRDKISLEQYRHYAHDETNEKVTHLIDPAFLSAAHFLSENKVARTEDHISINIRDVTKDSYGRFADTLEQKLSDIVANVAEQTNLPVILVPMHTFAIGGDDRIILDRIAKHINKENIIVQHVPLSLKETMQNYYDAALCVGMRFHSIVLQTILNGRNYVLDYTDPKKGKIIGMLDELNLRDKYAKRYLSLHADSETINIEQDCERYILDSSVLERYLTDYVKLIENIL